MTGGGIIKIGNGAAQIEGSGSENVTFVASASGGLLIDDAFLTPTAYSGNITSFGGAPTPTTASSSTSSRSRPIRR